MIEKDEAAYYRNMIEKDEVAYYDLTKAHYVWLDGNVPTQRLRSKTRVVPTDGSKTVELSSFPHWGFDGSSTYQSTGHNSDLILKPVYFCKDTVNHTNDRLDINYIVLCEVLTEDGKPHPTNSRSKLQDLLHGGITMLHEPWVGYEQEYVFFKNNRPLGWPEHPLAFPAPQGSYYCSVGSDVAFGRNIVEDHLNACIDAGLSIYGTNAEVMPGQWEFQIGYRGDGPAPILEMSDQLWVARYLLMLIAEKKGVSVSFDVKPVKGDWNGSGMHTNFSTIATRDPNHGMKTIEDIIERLSKHHKEHMLVYGANNEERLTGHHETCSIHEFRSGIADRGCSIRIPRPVSIDGHGYFEDRRPGANANPYDVAYALVSTILSEKKYE